MAKNRKTPDMNLPVWFDGQNINEALFCEEFLQERRIIFANGAFFTPDGRVTDDLPLRGEIYEKLKFCAVNNIPRKITNILEVLKLEAQEPDFPPEQDRIHVANGTLMLNGTFTEGKPAIVRSRLPIAYKPDAPAPVIWLNFLDGLLHAENIPTLQEFIGYCLIPSNKGQRMMVIKGNGGEGKYGIDKDFYEKKDLHIHAPEGAVPKDGPSAGVTMITGIISALGNIKVRSDVAMTGEITLSGKVLPIGGLREKTMAAYKAGVKTIIVPFANKGDLDDVDDTVKLCCEFVFAKTIQDVLDVALVPNSKNNVPLELLSKNEPERKKLTV